MNAENYLKHHSDYVTSKQKILGDLYKSILNKIDAELKNTPPEICFNSPLKFFLKVQLTLDEKEFVIKNYTQFYDTLLVDKSFEGFREIKFNPPGQGQLCINFTI